MGGGEDPQVQRDRFGAADALDGFLLQHPQQAHLDLRRQLPDFIQENGPAVGALSKRPSLQGSPPR
jgi:hypothetical protein